MVDALVLDLRRRVRAKNFDELPRRNLQVEPEQFSVLVKIKMPLQSQRAAIKIMAALEVAGKNAEMGKGFDHGWKPNARPTDPACPTEFPSWPARR